MQLPAWPVIWCLELAAAKIGYSSHKSIPKSGISTPVTRVRAFNSARASRRIRRLLAKVRLGDMQMEKLGIYRHLHLTTVWQVKKDIFLCAFTCSWGD